jgi:hypothetical protein
LKAIIDILLKTAISDRIYYEIRKAKAEKKVEMDPTKSNKGSTKVTRVYGMNTDNESRPKMIDILRTVINEGYDKINSKHIIDDIMGLERDKSGKIQHGANTHDDSLFSYLILYYIYVYGTNLGNFMIFKSKGFNKELGDIENFEELRSNIAGILQLNKSSTEMSEADKFINEFFEQENRKKLRELEEKDTSDSAASLIKSMNAIFNLNKT